MRRIKDIVRTGLAVAGLALAVIGMCNVTSVSKAAVGPSEHYKSIKRVSSGNYEYTVINEQEKKISLLKIKDYGENLVIPYSIDGYTVTGIGIPYSEENDCETLTKEDLEVIFPEESKNGTFTSDTVVSVNYARRCVIDYNDNKVKTLTIPNGISIIYESAFGNMTALTNIEFPNNSFRIMSSNFKKCNSLKKLEFKNRVDIERSFDGVRLDSIFVGDYFSCGSEEITGIWGEVDKIMILPQAFKKGFNCEALFLDLYSLRVNELILPKNTNICNKIESCHGNIKKLVINNPNMIIGKNCAYNIRTIEAPTSKVKCKYNKKTKNYTYTWAAPKNKIKQKYNKYNRREVEEKYEVYKITSSGKQVKVKSTDYNKITLKKKMKLMVKRIVNITRFLNINGEWYESILY